MNDQEAEGPQVTSRGEVIDMSKVEPLSRPAECTHDFAEEPDGPFIAVVCGKCHWGFLKQKSLT